MNGRDRVSLVVFLITASMLLVVGWKLLWFLTDDAYISFRYVSNSHLGHGYVWNPAPFRPVEGYTSFLWIAVLDAVWRLSGIAPPESSNYVSLLFSFLTLIVVSAMVLRMKWPDPLRRFRMLFLGLLLIGLAINRTFLTWSSSGLETAMFNFFLILWVYSCIFISPSSRWWTFSVSTSVLGIYLTRPDGLLFLPPTLLLLFSHFYKNKAEYRTKRLAGALPILVIVVHFLWRRTIYGEWLPNTYYAKFAGIWPESGIRYALSFILEYALWVWIGLFLLATVRKQLLRKKYGIAALVTVATLVLHALYYTFVIGGDHFEYRVYSHLIVLVFPSFVWLLNTANIRPSASIVVFVSFVLLSLPIPWTHWALTRGLDTREKTHKLRVSVSSQWPKGVRWYAGTFDKLQFWLIDHYVCVGRQEHKVNCEYIKGLFPPREEGGRLPAEDYPVFTFPAVGVVSWVLPRINIIDLHGLNDYVIARNPRNPSNVRMMAHDRRSPLGYAECFTPNVNLLEGRRIIVSKRSRPLTAERIVACETEWAERVRSMNR